MRGLQLGVALAGAWCAVALSFQLIRAKAYGTRTLFAPAAGNAAAGIRYAFTGALSPRAKESAREHPLAWAAGMAYHVGLFSSLACLGLPASQAPFAPQRFLALPCLLGATCGLGLLVKRSLHPELRGLSVPDDFLSNLLASGMALLAALQAFIPSLHAAFLVSGILVLVYAPLGKLRHMVFFFRSRTHLGAFFGRRGSFPPNHPEPSHGR